MDVNTYTIWHENRSEFTRIGFLAGAQVVKGVVQLISPICMAFLIRAAPFFTSSFTIRFSR